MSCNRLSLVPSPSDNRLQLCPVQEEARLAAEEARAERQLNYNIRVNEMRTMLCVLYFFGCGVRLFCAACFIWLTLLTDLWLYQNAMSHCPYAAGKCTDSDCMAELRALFAAVAHASRLFKTRRVGC